jgi:hypothetical protein
MSNPDARSASQSIIINTPFGTMLLVILSTLLVHTIYLIFNSIVVLGLLRLDLPEACCVIIMASQKVGGGGAPGAWQAAAPWSFAAANPPARGLGPCHKTHLAPLGRVPLAGSSLMTRPLQNERGAGRAPPWR